MSMLQDWNSELQPLELNLLEKGVRDAATSIAAVSIMLHNESKYLPA
jgi:hypothetical protein